MREAVVFDSDTAQMLSGSFMDYAMPRASDIPSISIGLHDVPCVTNPIGVKSGDAFKGAAATKKEEKKAEKQEKKEEKAAAKDAKKDAKEDKKEVKAEAKKEEKKEAKAEAKKDDKAAAAKPAAAASAKK